MLSLIASPFGSTSARKQTVLRSQYVCRLATNVLLALAVIMPASVTRGVAAPVAIDLGTLGGSSSFVIAVNGRGQAVGYSYTAEEPTYHAFSWTAAGGMVDHHSKE